MRRKQPFKDHRYFELTMVSAVRTERRFRLSFQDVSVLLTEVNRPGFTEDL